MANGDYSKQCRMYSIPGNAGRERESKESLIKTKKEKRNKRKKTRVNHSFISPFIAFATAKLDLAIICLDSFVTSGIA